MDCSLCRLGTLTVPCPKTDRSGQVCDRCKGTGSRLHRTQIVWGQGSIQADIMLLGEAPGYYEDLEGLPFRPNAPAGRVLHQALAAVDLPPLSLFISNIVKCRPPNNKLRDYPDAILTCRVWLDQELDWVRPKVIVALGALAGQRWFPGMRAGEMAEVARATEGYVVVGSYHPSYVARGSDPRAYASLCRSLTWAKELAI